MSDIVDFLERMGRDAQLRHASRSEIELALAGTQIGPALQAAILAQDRVRLEGLLGQANICCMIQPGKEEEEEEEEEDTEENPSQEGEQEGEETSPPSAAGVVALVA